MRRVEERAGGPLKPAWRHGLSGAVLFVPEYGRFVTNIRLREREWLMCRYVVLAAGFVIWAGGAAVGNGQDVHVRVSPDVKTGIEGTTEFPTIQMAMDHHPFAGKGADGKPGRVYIEIAPGVYHERVIVTQNHTNITLVGMGKSPADVVITNSLNAKQAGGTFFTETVEINGDGFEAAGNFCDFIAVRIPDLERLGQVRKKRAEAVLNFQRAFAVFPFLAFFHSAA